MLVLYSTVLRKQEFLKRLSDDTAKAALVANELTCNLKTLAVISAEERLDSSLEELKDAETNLNHLNAMISNLRENLQGYINSLSTNVQKETESKEVNQPSLPEDPKQISDVLSAIKSLKELRDSLPNESKKV